jgi:putative ABC transport system permease protein
MSGLVYGVPALDPVTYLVVPAILAAAALLACWIPARRAAATHPAAALRTDEG